MQKRSFTFRTHQRIDNMHRPIQLVVKVKDEPFKLDAPLMTILIRMFILGLADPFVSTGKILCQTYDQEKMTELGIIAENGHAAAYNEDRIRYYYLTLPQNVSFKLFEYEKQILYFKCWIAETVVVEQIRYLYHTSNPFTILPYISDSELISSLFIGITQPIFQQFVEFQKYQIYPE